MTDKQYPKVAVGALIVNNNNEIFLGKTHKWKGKWCVPGGHLEWGEKMEDTVKREVKEELNLDVNNVHLLHVQESVLSKDFHEERHFIFLDFACNLVGGKVKLNPEFQDYVWVTPEKALEMPINKSTKILIEKFLETR
jgi:nucleoside triphosphatase